MVWFADSNGISDNQNGNLGIIGIGRISFGNTGVIGFHGWGNRVAGDHSKWSRIIPTRPKWKNTALMFLLVYEISGCLGAELIESPGQFRSIDVAESPMGSM